jgi:hypothetical protein
MGFLCPEPAHCQPDTVSPTNMAGDLRKRRSPFGWFEVTPENPPVLKPRYRKQLSLRSSHGDLDFVKERCDDAPSRAGTELGGGSRSGPLETASPKAGSA